MIHYIRGWIVASLNDVVSIYASATGLVVEVKYYTELMLLLSVDDQIAYQPPETPKITTSILKKEDEKMRW